MFDDVPGQEKVKEMFARALRERTLSHAYLLSGPEGLAKTAFARELAVALVSACGGCGTCPECERARRGIHPDLHVVEREGDLIRFEQVGPVIADLGLKPFSGSRRVWIIPEVEYLHPAAANKLLKSVEEPPDYVYFLLVTDRLERVLPTIVSRCQQVEFRPLSDAQVAMYLRESHGLDGVAAEALARLSGGAVERAARLARDADRRADFLKQVALLLAGVRGDKAADAQRAFIGVLERHQKQIKDDAQEQLKVRVAELERQFQDKRDRDWYVKKAEERAKREEGRLRRLAAQDAVDLLGAWVRDLWVVACGASDVLWNCDRADELAGAAVATPEYYARLMAVVARTRKDLYLNIDQKLALQALFARFEEVAESA
ncbi:MAG: DNA polymerase III subunit delta' [Actinobacteria bacterium]|nr:DNA polymerase III subunit delta' [Actinomycetota bacterium]